MVPRVLAFLLLATSLASAQTTPKALVDQWLDAQNRGDFAAYGRLYAQAFTGIRRSKGSAVELDRAGWLKDRERMFKKPMVVTATEVTVDDLRVRFVQTWASGTYQDTGRKQLTLVREGAELRIAREELLESVSADELPRLDAAGLAALKLLYPRGVKGVLAVKIVARPTSKQRAVLLVFGQPAAGDVEAVPETLELALIGDAVIARGKWDFELPLSEGIEMTGIRTYTPELTLQPEAFLVAPGEHAVGLEVDLTVHENGPADGSVTRRHLMLFRALDGKLHRVLSLQTMDDTGDAECGSGTWSKLELAPTQTAGVNDLSEEHKVHKSTFTGSDCKNRISTSRRLWKWKGTRYAR